MKDVKNSIQKRNYAGALIHVFAFPIEWLMKEIKIVKTTHQKIFSIIISSMVLLFGAWMSTVEQEYLAKFVWDGVSWSVHGLGFAPLAKHIFDFLKMEV